MGSYNQLHMYFHMSRRYETFFLSLFLPSLSLTVLSWAVFWINVKLIAERLGLTITLILAQVVLIIGVAGQFPSVSDLKVVDIYVIVNFLFNVGSLVESLVAAKLSECRSSCLRGENEELSGTEVQTTKTGSWIDIVSWILFPAAFIAWNVAFFWYINECSGIYANQRIRLDEHWCNKSPVHYLYSIFNRH